MRFILLLLLPLSSLADEYFVQHVQSVSRAMSAFYMHELNEGDKQYWADFLVHRDQASLFANRMPEDLKEVYDSRWRNIVPMLRFVEVRGSGLNLDEYVRLQFRQYLTHIYLELEKRYGQKFNLDMGYTYSALITARSMDLASSHYGPQALSVDDLSLDSSIVVKKIQSIIKRELNKDDSRLAKSQIRKLQSRIRFVESSLVNYDRAIPYLLLYSNIEKIDALLKKTEQIASE